VVGGHVVFRVAVNSFDLPTYQWRFNGESIPGATNQALEFVDVQLNQAGDYTVVVSNGVGSVESAVARLVVLASGCTAPSFAAARPVDAGPNPGWGAVGDFNGDGKADVAVVNTGSGSSVSVLLCNGDGSFQAPIASAVGTNPFSPLFLAYVATSDFNGDGKLDLVTVARNAVVSVLMGNGDGTFQPAVDYLAWGVSLRFRGVHFRWRWETLMATAVPTWP